MPQREELKNPQIAVIRMDDRPFFPFTCPDVPVLGDTVRVPVPDANPYGGFGVIVYTYNGARTQYGFAIFE